MRLLFGRRGTIWVSLCALLLADGALHVVPVRAQKASVADSISILWDTPTKSPISVAITPDAAFICVLTDDGDLTYYSGEGKPLWQKTVDNAKAVAVSDDGQIILTYSPIDPLNRHISIMDSDGRIRWTQEVAASVWSVAVSPDGSAAVVGTGDKRVYVYSIRNKSLKYRRHVLPGIPISMTFDSSGQHIIAGLWQDSGVGMFDLDSKEVWRQKGKIDLAYNAALSCSGDRILCRVEPNRPGQDVTLLMSNTDGKSLWQKRLRVDDVRAGMSVDGTLVAASYRETINRRGKSLSERRLALFNPSGSIAWEKGGMFSKPELMCMMPDDRILVSSDNTVLYLLDSKGRTTSKLKLDAKIVQYHPAQVAGRVLIYCSDGRMHMLAVAGP